MPHIRPASLLFLSLCLLCQAGAAVVGKIAALRMDRPTLAAFLTNPWYLATLAFLVLQAFLWQIVLRRVPLFIAYLFTSLNYLVLLAISRIVFLERVSAPNVLGAAVIASGVYLLLRKEVA